MDEFLKAAIDEAKTGLSEKGIPIGIDTFKRALAKIPLQGTLVLTCEDGVLAGRAAMEARALVDRPVRALEGGNAAWLAAGHALTAADGKMADEAVDAWLKPYERPHDKAAAMREYLSWEIDLPARIARDGSANFIEFRP